MGLSPWQTKRVLDGDRDENCFDVEQTLTLVTDQSLRLPHWFIEPTVGLEYTLAEKTGGDG